MTLANNIKEVVDKIKESAKKSNRNMEEVQLIAVTKTVDIDVMKVAIDLGITDVGENKVQELVRKYEAIGPVVKWHLIGHLQRNKVKYIIDKVDLIHSVDSYRLAEEINNRAKDIDRIVDCLVQVNVSGEESKYGVSPEDAKELLKEVSQFSNIRIMGLMTMAPNVDEPEEARQYFIGLKAIANEITNMSIENVEMKYLSMGMSNDFDIAVEEGANLVRVGSLIFGERDYSK